ncbi:MAG: dephospho-CoA kinase [Rickettsiales bacterium]|nr:dephospho-CoA kinase [Rickettsiales bacterium]
MKIIGLSGGVASGKNFIADIFAKKGAAVFDADAEVHKLLELDKSTIDEVKKIFPESFIDKKINRKILGKIVFADEKKLRILEKILHPKVRENYQKFLKQAKKEKREIAVLNIPLLLENEGYKCDYIVAILIPPSIQRKRFLMRAKAKSPKNFLRDKNNLIKKFEQIRSKQITNSERKNLADFVIYNNKSKAFVSSQVNNLINTFKREIK